MFVNVHQVGLTVRKFRSQTANFIRHMVGHVTLTMSAWPKYGYRSLVGCRLPRLCSYSNDLLAYADWFIELSCFLMTFSNRILAPDQSMTWFSFATWSVMADLLVMAWFLLPPTRTWPSAWWSSPLANETSQLGTAYASGCVIWTF